MDDEKLRLRSSYPLVYCIVGLPLTISRWIQFSGHTTSPAAILVGSAIYDAGGFCNVLLFYFTRRNLFLFGGPEHSVDGDVSGEGLVHTNNNAAEGRAKRHSVDEGFQPQQPEMRMIP